LLSLHFGLLAGLLDDFCGSNIVIDLDAFRAWVLRVVGEVCLARLDTALGLLGLDHS